MWMFWTLAFAFAQEMLPTQTIRIGAQEMVVEVADELHERQLGLMYRKSLEIDKGMIFVYPEAKERSFWMKNTHIPLSIAYIDAECKIVHIADMVPLSTKGVPSVYPAQFALEVNQGWFSSKSIKVGDTIGGIQHCE